MVSAPSAKHRMCPTSCSTTWSTPGEHLHSERAELYHPLQQPGRGSAIQGLAVAHAAAAYTKQHELLVPTRGRRVCSNASVIAPLLERSRTLGAGGPRLLRLLCRCLFNGGLYTQRSRIARGAYAHVSTLLSTLGSQQHSTASGSQPMARPPPRAPTSMMHRSYERRHQHWAGRRLVWL